MALDPPISATLGEVNVALAGAINVLNPLSAQLDGLLAAGIGPYQADLQAQLSGSLSMQASLAIQIGNPFVQLQLAIQALAQLQAALTMALTLPTIDVSISAELNAQAALAGALSAKLGAIQATIELAVQAKAAALQASANAQASLSAGPVFAFSFSGDSLETTGGEIGAAFASGLSDPPNTIAPGDSVSGVVILTKDPAAAAAIAALFST